MCGINCIFDPHNRLKNKAALVQFMDNQMVYRGPDDEGIYHDDCVALGMRRLSIIDVSGGRQPLYNEDRSLVLVCNGEIYNYVELARDLKERGHSFRSGSDAETILHLYEDQGEGCLTALRGMFAFVLWDRKQQRLFAARDRIGIKPLYFSEVGGLLWLSSELKAIAGAAGISPTLRPAAVYQFLRYSYPIDQRHTPVEEIKRVLPGEYLVADPAGTKFQSYWTLGFSGDRGNSNRDDQEIFGILRDSVSLHLRSDVPVGILLSGGIDSSCLAALAAQSGGNYTALCAGYAGNQAVDERPQAHRTASYLGLSHVDVLMGKSLYEDNFDQLVNFCDEPVGDVAAIPQWSLYQQARELGYKVLLSGIGGDEVFFGYPTWNAVGEHSRRLAPGDFKNWIGFDQDEWQARLKSYLHQISGPVLLEAEKYADEPLRRLRDQAPQGPDAMAAILFGSYLVHNGCQLADKLGMGCSVEVRVPFLDHMLVQAIFDLPLARRFDKDVSKVLLKRLLRQLVPDEVLDAPKRGFTPPITYNDFLVMKRLDVVRDGILAQTGWIDRQKLDKFCSGHAAFPWLRNNKIRKLLGIPTLTTPLFLLLAFETWYSYLKNLPAPPAASLS